jgi:hypothetical protein
LRPNYEHRLPSLAFACDGCEGIFRFVNILGGTLVDLPDLSAYTECMPTTKKSNYASGKRISAIEAIAAKDGKPNLGLLTQIPVDTIEEISGTGFSMQTVQVRAGALHYFVFREDIDIPLEAGSFGSQARSHSA